MMRKYFCLFVGIALLLGCGGQGYTPPNLSGYVWPPPPNPPKIKLIHVIRTDIDVRAKSTSEMLFGEESFFYFKKPHGIAVDMEGNIYVSDSYKREVSILNLEKGTVGAFHNPYGWKQLGAIAADNVNGLLGVTSGNLVLIFDQKSRKLKLELGQRGELARPKGLAFDPPRKIIYVADTKTHEVHAFGYDGTYIAQVTGPGSGPEDVYFPTGLATDAEGNLFIVDSMHWRVQIFDSDGIHIRSFGGHGDVPGMFARPKSIAISQDGYVFVTDAAFGNFQVFDIKGNTYTFVGSPGFGFGKFNQPQGIFIDKDDKIYVVDQTNRRVQIFQYLSERYLKEQLEESKIKEQLEEGKIK
jgi:DNA-binding beta-propeller fold protein YncE